MTLRRYQQMRDFARTPEPRGAAPKGRGAGRFVVQKHDATRLHYDFRLELDGVLKSWAIPRGPSLDPEDRRLAVQVEDHPVEYGGFEGVIPEGEYGGGTVVVWDRGRWHPDGDARRGLEKGHLRFRLDGEKLRGGYSLVRMHGGDNWLLIKSEDDVASGDGEALVRERPESVTTGRTLAEVADESDRVWHSKPKRAKARGGRLRRTKGAASPAVGPTPKPAAIAPELATLVDEVPAGEGWLHEIKYDGYRLIARIDRGAVQLLTRSHEDWAPRFPWLVEALRAQVPAESAVLDGELVHLGADGVTRFGALQKALAAGTHRGLVYFAFDLLHLQGVDVRGVPLAQRKQALAELLKELPANGRVRVSEHIAGGGGRLLGRACKLGLEGVISKRADSTYAPGRHRDWLKIKCSRRQEVVIGGFTESRIGPRRIGALLVGVYDEAGAYQYSGKVGTGFDQATARDLRARLDELAVQGSPFAELPSTVARSRFVRPQLVAEVEFSEWTADGRLRHPVFVGLREDKRARDVRRERPDAASAERPAKAAKKRPAKAAKKRPAKAAKPARATAASGAGAEVLGVPISHPDRVLYPDDELSKLDIARYFAAVAEWMLPWVASRGLSVLRCPEGIAGECFFQRHLHHALPAGVRAVKLSGERAPYLYVEDAGGLVALAQVGALELHAWGSTVDRPDDPDRMVFDLDPGPDVPWARIKETAVAVRTRLADLDLDCFLAASGGKGLHVVVPLTRGRQTWADVKAFAHGVSREFAAAAPRLFIATASKAGRAGKIYLDYLRNARGATAIAPYSPRARPGAPVAVPLRWDELAGLSAPNKYTVRTILRRLASLKRDPWQDLPRTRQSLRVATLREVLGRAA